MKFLSLLLIFLVIVFLDKGLTFLVIQETWKNFPEDIKDDIYKAEKNPAAKWFFQKLGLGMGTLVYGLISILTLFLVFFILQLLIGETIALFIIFLIYGLVVFNNAFHLLRFAGVIP